jgi:hypothetical protein
VQLPEVKKLANGLILFDNTANGRGVRLVAHFHEGELVKLAAFGTKLGPARFLQGIQQVAERAGSRQQQNKVKIAAVNGRAPPL